MLTTVLEFLAAWSVVAAATGFALGAAIKRAERIRKEVFLTGVLARLEALQASQN